MGNNDLGLSELGFGTSQDNLNQMPDQSEFTQD